MTNVIKNILIGGIIIAVLFAAFKILVVDKKSELPLTKTPSAKVETSTASVTKEAAFTLQKIQSIKVDSDIFFSSTFKSLKDFRVSILPEAVGRDNPFAPIK